MNKIWSGFGCLAFSFSTNISRKIYIQWKWQNRKVWDLKQCDDVLVVYSVQRTMHMQTANGKRQIQLRKRSNKKRFKYLHVWLRFQVPSFKQITYSVYIHKLIWSTCTCSTFHRFLTTRMVEIRRRVAAVTTKSHRIVLTEQQNSQTETNECICCTLFWML